jgi:hypothetical protein
MLTSRIVLIIVKYDPLIPQVPWAFGIPPAAKSGQPTTTWMSLADWRWCGATGMNELAGGVGQVESEAPKSRNLAKIKADQISAFPVEQNLSRSHCCGAASLLHFASLGVSSLDSGRLSWAAFFFAYNPALIYLKMHDPNRSLFDISSDRLDFRTLKLAADESWDGHSQR